MSEDAGNRGSGKPRASSGERPGRSKRRPPPASDRSSVGLPATPAGAGQHETTRRNADETVYLPPSAGISTTRQRGPANPKQVEFLRAIGLTPPETCTLQDASQLILRAQNARFYAWKVARQAWGADLDGRALRPIIRILLDREADAARVVERMDEYLAQLLAEAEVHPDQQSPEAAEGYAPDLPEDDLFAFVRKALARAHPDLAERARPSARASISQEQEQLGRIRRELEPHFYVGREEPLDRVRAMRVPLGLAAAGAVALAVLAWMLFGSRPAEEPAPRARPEPRGAEPPALDLPARTRGANLRLWRYYRSDVALPLQDRLPRDELDHAPDKHTSRLESGGYLKVVAVLFVADARWYQVDAFDADHRIQGRWWLEAAKCPPNRLTEVSAELLADAEVEGRALPPPPPPAGEAPAAKPLDPVLEKVLGEFTLPNGLTLRETVETFRESATARGWTVWTDDPVSSPNADGVTLNVTWTVSWKTAPEANWERRTGSWRADQRGGTLEPLNPDAQAFALLGQDLKR
ncbi:MAG: hypothetical protein M5U26_17470 [Planctomycetota bacterium]|nr:hypothetical protein [Planctomycetota bacterium]